MGRISSMFLTIQYQQYHDEPQLVKENAWGHLPVPESGDV